MPIECYYVTKKIKSMLHIQIKQNKNKLLIFENILEFKYPSYCVYLQIVLTVIQKVNIIII